MKIETFFYQWPTCNRLLEIVSLHDNINLKK